VTESSGSAGPGKRDAPHRTEIEEIGRRVRAARNDLGWSLRRLAEAAGVSASLLSAVENGKIVPSVASLFSISDALQRPAEYFFPHSRRRTLIDPEQGALFAVEPPHMPRADESPGGPHVRTVDDPPSSEDRAFSPGEDPVTQHEVSRSTGASTRARRIQRAVRAVGTPLSRPISPSISPPATNSRSIDDLSSQVVEAIDDSEASIAATTRSGSPAIPVIERERIAGVRVTPAAERPKMDVGHGVSWSSVVDPGGSALTVIEVTLSMPSTLDVPYRSHAYPVEVVVTGGKLTLDASFSRVVLGKGDVATISAGVPHRFNSSDEGGTTFLVLIQGHWDGSV